MRNSTLQNALPIVAAAYGEKFGVKVSIGTDLAYTDGNKIVVPNVPDDYPNKDVVWGYLAHEAAHVRFTDFGVKRRAGIHAALTNILEDCRIERAMMALYPGTAQTLNEVARYMAQAGHYHHVTDKWPPASILAGFCLYWLQTKVVGQTVLQDYLDSAKAVFERVFPQGVVVRINALLRKAVDARSTADAASLADEIIQMIEEEKEKEEKKSGNGQSQAADNRSSSGDGQREDKNQSQTDDNSGGHEQGKHQGDQGKSQDSQEKPHSGQAQAQQGGSCDTSKQNPAELLVQVLEAGAGDLRGDAHETLKKELSQVAQENEDTRCMTVPTAIEVKGDPDTGKSLLAEVRSATAKIRARLYGLVQASRRMASHSQRRGKRIDARNLHRLVVGDTRVFLSTIAKRRPNTAVHLLVDMSGSMKVMAANGELRQEIARKASLAMAIALEAIPGVNPAVTFFAEDADNPVFSIVKHGEKPQRQAAKFAFNARGYTPMTEAIWYAAFELTKTREERKMLLVITDGEPDDLSSCRSVVSLCERSGIEVSGIGIETDTSNLFRESITIDEVGSLQKALFGLMQQSLTAFVA